MGFLTMVIKCSVRVVEFLALGLATLELFLSLPSFIIIPGIIVISAVV
jgi:hypothetical protein